MRKFLASFLLVVGFVCLAQAQLPNAVTVLGVSNCPLDGNDPFTTVLLHFDGTNGSTTFKDSSRNNIPFTVGAGTVALNTSTKKFGTASGNWTANGSNIDATTFGNGAYDFQAGNFTVDAWVIPPTGTGGGNLTSNNGFAAASGWSLGVGSTSQKPFLQAFNGASVIASYASTGSFLTQSVFNHIAWVRSGSNVFFFLNGVSQSLNVPTAIGGSTIPSSPFALAVGNVSTFQPSPSVDEYRISKSARWTSNFTPPTVAYCP